VTGPSVFIGSSSEGLDVAHEFQAAIASKVDCEPLTWDQGTFGAGNYTMESLVEATRRSDFAVLVMTPDDVIESRGVSNASPRDNVLFELGLFMGALGVKRVLMLQPQAPPGEDSMKLPSDLGGITRLSNYPPRDDGNLRGALLPAVLEAAKVIRSLGKRSDETTAKPPIAIVSAPDTAVTLSEQIRHICEDAVAQGWHCKRSSTTLRLTSPKGRRLSYPISADPVAAQAALQLFVRELRAAGLRVNRRAREQI
jgi:hypothetical protein